VTLTDAGEELLPHARAALAAVERGRDAIASLRGVLRGRLRIGVAGPVDRRLSQALGEFHRAHPGVEVMLTIQNNEPPLEAVAGAHMDVGIVGVGVRPLPSQVRTRVIAHERLVLAVSRDHPLARRTRATLAELRDQPFVTLVHGSGHREAFEKAFDDAGFVPRVAAEAGELSSLIELAAEGLGAAILPRSAADGANVAVLEISRPRLVRRTALAWNDATTSPAGRAFLALAERSL
jgi:DNA-binding transcriptional LysR family regulator